MWPTATIGVTGTTDCSDLAFQTGAIVIDSKDRILLVEEPVTRFLMLPRSPYPHNLDNLAASPLGFLLDIASSVESLPLCEPFQVYQDNQPRPRLGFSGSVTTAPFAIALNIAFLCSDQEGVPDGRQSVVWWYSAIVRDHHVNQFGGAVRFLSIEDAVDVIQRQELYDVVALQALRLFKELWAATKRLPPEQQLKGPRQIPPFVRHIADEECYAAQLIVNPTFPIETGWTEELVPHAFWSASDYLVQTGIILLDKRRELVYLVHDATGNFRTFPRGFGDDCGKLMQDPLAGANIECTRLALPRLWKKYNLDPVSRAPVPELALRLETTTDPFEVSFHTVWDILGERLADSRGRQGITFWYGGCFDADGQLGSGIAVPISKAVEMLDEHDQFAARALDIFNELWDVVKNDSPVSTSSHS